MPPGSVGVDSTLIDVPLNAATTTRSTTTARSATEAAASRSRCALEGRGRDMHRETTPVRRSLALDRGSDLAIGSAGYSRANKKGGMTACRVGRVLARGVVMAERRELPYGSWPSPFTI